jgi:hypothetical protein
MFCEYASSREKISIKYVAYTGPPYYATAFEPTEGAMKIAHHMRLFSCAPGKILNFKSFFF